MADQHPEMRDVGPYKDFEQALRQFADWKTGLPMPDHRSAGLMISETALLLGAQPTEFELDYVGTFGYDPVLATILHGWMMRIYAAAKGVKEDRT